MLEIQDRVRDKRSNELGVVECIRSRSSPKNKVSNGEEYFIRWNDGSCAWYKESEVKKVDKE